MYSFLILPLSTELCTISVSLSSFLWKLLSLSMNSLFTTTQNQLQQDLGRVNQSFLIRFPRESLLKRYDIPKLFIPNPVFNFVLCKSSINIRIKFRWTFTYYKDKYYWFGSSLWLFTDLSVHSFCRCLESSWALLCFDHQ